MNDFSNSFLSFLNPSDLQFYCSFDVFHLEKLENVIFQIGKKKICLEKYFFHFYTRKDRKSQKTYSVTIIVLNFHCLNNLFQCNFEIFQGTEAKKSAQNHYKFLAFGLEFAKLFLDSLFLTSLPWKNSKLHQNKFFSQQVRTIMVTKYHFYSVGFSLKH